MFKTSLFFLKINLPNFAKNFRGITSQNYYQNEGVKIMIEKFKEDIMEQAEKNFKKALAGETLTKDELEIILFANKMDNKNFNIQQILPMISSLLGGII